MKRYEKYKDSGVEWIGKVPEHWEVNRLKYEALVQPSNVDKKSYKGEEKVLLCNYIDVYKNEFIDSSINFMEATATEDEIRKFKIVKGDVLVTKDSETPDDIANPALVKDNLENVICSYHLTQIRPTQKRLFGEYLFRLFQEHKFNGQFQVNANGVTRFGLSVSCFSDAYIPLPTTYEQTAIAKYLEEKTAQIDTLIANKQKLIDLLREERTAIINHAVTKGIDPNIKLKPIGIEWLGDIPEHWEVKRFKYWFDLVTIKSGDQENKIGLENIESKTGRFITTDSQFEGEGVDFELNDILFGKLRPYLAKVYLADFNGSAVGDFFIFRGKESIYPKFAAFRMLNYSFIEIINSSTYGAKMPRVSWEFISNLPIAFPNREEQIVIGNHIKTQNQRIEGTITRIEKEIELLQEYRTALISEVVTGKIKVI